MLFQSARCRNIFFYWNTAFDERFAHTVVRRARWLGGEAIAHAECRGEDRMADGPRAPNERVAAACHGRAIRSPRVNPSSLASAVLEHHSRPLLTPGSIRWLGPSLLRPHIMSGGVAKQEKGLGRLSYRNMSFSGLWPIGSRVLTQSGKSVSSHPSRASAARRRAFDTAPARPDTCSRSMLK